MIADRMIPPQAWATPSVSRPLALILGASCFGVGPAGEPPALHVPYVVCHGLGFLLLSGCIGLGVLLRQLPRRHHDKAQRLLNDASIAVFDLYLAEHPLATPVPGCLLLRPPGLLHQPGQGGWRAPPRFEFLPDRTRARDERDESALGLKTDTQGTTTRGRTIRDDAAPPCPTSGQALRDGDGGFHPITAVAIAQANAYGYPPLPAHS
jgi:hypothetical protein